MFFTTSRINFDPGSRARSKGPNIGYELVHDGNPVLGFARDYRSFVVISPHEICSTPRASRRATAVTAQLPRNLVGDKIIVTRGEGATECGHQVAEETPGA